MILVTGANGLLGRYVVKELLKRGEAVRCLVHRGSAGLPSGVTAVGGDVRDLEAMRRAVKGVDRVVHLVAMIRERRGWSRRRRITFEAVNVQGTANVVQAAEEAGVERLLHVSALGAKDDRNYRYTHSKWLGEREVVKSRLGWTIVQPSVLYGEGFGFFDRLDRSIHAFPPPFAPLPGGGTTRFQPIHAGDVARCIVEALPKGKYSQRVIKLGGPEQLTYAEMLDILLQLKGMRRYKLSIPIPLMRMVVPPMGWVMRDPPVTSVELKQLDIHNITVVDAVERQFGFRPHKLREGLGPLLADRP